MIEATGFYVGIRNRLKWKSALLHVYPTYVKAQFDDRTVKEAFGWHYFPKDAFIIQYRMVSEGPNIQQIPRHTEEGRKIAEAFRRRYYEPTQGLSHLASILINREY